MKKLSSTMNRMNTKTTSGLASRRGAKPGAVPSTAAYMMSSHISSVLTCNNKTNKTNKQVSRGVSGKQVEEEWRVIRITRKH